MTISEKALLFLDENHRQNDKQWFTDHKEDYRRLVEAPMLELAASLGPTLLAVDPALEIDPRRTISRIWRDTRFSRDKSLFKRSVWISFKKEKGLSHPVYFFEFTPDFHRYGCGYYDTPANVMEFIRREILANSSRFHKARDSLKKLPHFSLEGDSYKRPKYADQPAELRQWLNLKSVTAMYTSQDQSFLCSDLLVGTVRDAFEKLVPFYEFLRDCHGDAMNEDQSIIQARFLAY